MIKGRCFSLRKLDVQQIIYPSYIQIWLKILIIIFLDMNSHLVKKKFKIFFEFFIISLHIAPKPKGDKCSFKNGYRHPALFIVAGPKLPFWRKKYGWMCM